ncbi:hypothetical protein [Arthrobacter dokdonensis]|uniref:hypothetical protein n=1 Tax=Arthrobacter dokdonellae TaxID=2211210 RepID=UPI001494DBC1|nr:hypothetical protein [Arthrobacter dokdonellae]
MSNLETELFVVIQLAWELKSLTDSDKASSITVRTDYAISIDSWRFIERMIVPCSSTGNKLQNLSVSSFPPKFLRDQMMAAGFESKTLILAPNGIRSELIETLLGLCMDESEPVDHVWFDSFEGPTGVLSDGVGQMAYGTDFRFDSPNNSRCTQVPVIAALFGALPILLVGPYTDVVLFEAGSTRYKPIGTTEVNRESELSTVISGIQNFMNTAICSPVRISNFGESISNTSIARIIDYLEPHKLEPIRSDIRTYFANNPSDGAWLILSDLAENRFYREIDYSAALAAVGLDVEDAVFDATEADVPVSDGVLGELFSRHPVPIDIMTDICRTDLALIYWDIKASRAMRVLQIAMARSHLDWTRRVNYQCFNARSNFLSRLAGDLIAAEIGRSDWPVKVAISETLSYENIDISIPNPWPIGFARASHSLGSHSLGLADL